MCMMMIRADRPTGQSQGQPFAGAELGNATHQNEVVSSPDATCPLLHTTHYCSKGLEHGTRRCNSEGQAGDMSCRMHHMMGAAAYRR